MSKSIVTLQLGNYSNFIGTHYWNLNHLDLENKLEYDSDIHFQEGFNTFTKERSYTPRLISWDWKQNLGPRNIDGTGDLSDFKNSNHFKSFNGDIKIYDEFSGMKNNIGNLTDFTEWNQFVYKPYNKKSLYSLPKTFRTYDSTNFSSFTQGQDLFSSPNLLDEFENQIRYFVENCDFIQGFKLFSDLDGFSGQSIKLLDHLSDEYNRNIFSFPVTSKFEEDNINQIFNTIFLTNSMNSSSVIWSPLSMQNIVQKQYINLEPFISYHPSSKYQTSSLLALAIKSSMLPLFSKNASIYQKDFQYLVSGRRSKMVNLGCSLPFTLLNSENSLINCLEETRPGNIYTSLNPFGNGLNSAESVIGSIYGNFSLNERVLRKSKFKHANHLNDILEMYINQEFLPEVCKFYSTQNNIGLAYPFPDIFNGNVINSKTGYMMESYGANQPKKWSCPKSIPFTSVIYTSNEDTALNTMHNIAKDVLKKQILPTNLLNYEKDLLVEGIENFRDII